MLVVTRTRVLASLVAVLVLPALGTSASANQAPPPPPPPEAAPVNAAPPPPPPPPPPAVDVVPLTPAPSPPAAPVAPPTGGLKIEGSGATAKLGFLLQPAYEFSDGSASSTVDSQSIFLRRARLLLGMTLGSSFELFFETDSPNLGKSLTPPAGGGVAPSAGMNVQDAFMTWKPADEFKLDVGMMLIPLSHNGLQSAASLYGWDYFAYSFQQNAPLANYIGRDVGAQLRGLIINHLEYRVGVFTGRRAAAVPTMADPTPAVPPRTPMRIAGRIQYNVFDAENGFFYGGTYGGAKRILSFGAGIDHQDDYTAFAVDGFLDFPLGENVITAQAGFVQYDGGTWLTLPKQADIMAEAGFRIGALKLSPIVRFEHQNFDDAATGDMSRFAAGLAWWPMGHNMNVKAFYTYVKPDAAGATKWSQINLQTQFFLF